MSLKTLTTTFLVGAVLCTAAQAQKIDVVHYWTAGSESAAINVLADAYRASGGTWNDIAAPGFDEAVALTISGITGGEGPSALLATPGSTVDELYESGMLRDFNDLAASQGWQDTVPQMVWDAMTVGDNVVALPMGLHANNWIYYSKPVFDELGLSEPQSWEDLFATLDTIKAAGYVPLALGGQNWQITYLFTNAVLGTGGAELYEAIFIDHDADAAASPEVVQAFEYVRRLNDYVDEGSPGRDWNVTTHMIIEDKAGMHMMGDWALGEFNAAGEVGGVDYGCFLAPAEKSPYLVVVDAMVFPTPDAGGEAAGQDMLAGLIMKPDVMAGVSAKKGSVPALNTVAQDALDHCAGVGAAAASDSANVMPTTFMSLDADSRGRMADLIGQFWADPNMRAEDAAAQLKAIIQGAM